MNEEYKHVTAWIQWHLTPTGWVSGTSKDEEDLLYEKPIPEDCVLTLSHGTAGSEARGKTSKTSVVWQTNNFGLIERLKEQFGAQPASFWTYFQMPTWPQLEIITVESGGRKQERVRGR